MMRAMGAIALVLAGLVAAPAAAVADTADCALSDGTMTWGFKESFRSYISSTIANGEWAVADGATYQTPEFGWTSGEGTFTTSSGGGSLAFIGSVTFTGHGGILNTTVANPVVSFVSPTTAHLLLDVSGTTQEGAVIDEKQVQFAALDLAAGTTTVTGHRVSIRGATATLLPAGASAFGTYEAGEPLDPAAITFTAGAGCAFTESQPAPITPAPADNGLPLWLLTIPGAVLVAGAIVLSRRRQGA